MKFDSYYFSVFDTEIVVIMEVVKVKDFEICIGFVEV